MVSVRELNFQTAYKMMSQPSILGERRDRKTQLYTTLFEALHKNYPPLPEKKLPHQFRIKDNIIIVERNWIWLKLRTINVHQFGDSFDETATRWNNKIPTWKQRKRRV